MYTCELEWVELRDTMYPDNYFFIDWPELNCHMYPLAQILAAFTESTIHMEPSTEVPVCSCINAAEVDSRYHKRVYGFHR